MRNGHRTPITRTQRLVAAVVIALTTVATAVAVTAAPAGAEIGTFGEAGWGVYEIDPDTYATDAIQNQVFAIEQVGNRVFVAGKFLEVRPSPTGTPTSRPYLAAFDATTGDFIPSFAPVLEGPAYALETDGTKLFVGGEFLDIDGEPGTEGLAALDPLTGAVDPTWRSYMNRKFTTDPSVVFNLDRDGTYLYAGGNFNRVGGPSVSDEVTVFRTAKLALTDGTPDANWAPEVQGGSIWGIAVAPDSSRVYLAGYQTSVNSAANTEGLAVVDNTTGASVTGLVPWVGNSTTRNYMQDVEVYADKVWVGGSEHALWQLDASDLSIEHIHSTDRGGDYQDIEVVGNRVYASCHCYTHHYANYDYWPQRSQPIPINTVSHSSHLVHAYDAATGDYLDEFNPDVSATRSGVWAVHGDTIGCLWVGGDVSRTTRVDSGDEGRGGFARLCDQSTRVLDPRGDWRYWDSGSPPSGWNQVGFDDSSWSLGGAPLGNNGKPVDRTMLSGGGAWYFRTTFDVPANLLGKTTSFSLLADDGAIVYLNGQEIIRENLPGGTISHGTNASSSKGTNDETYDFFTQLNPPFVAGTNTVAVQLHTASSSSDFIFDMEIAISDTSAADTIPPTAPENLTATRIENQLVVIRWDDANDNVGVDHYDIYRDGVLIDSRTDNGAAQFWYVNSGLTAGTTYDYEIRAVDASGNESPGATLQVTTTGGGPDTEAPSEPPNLTATNIQNNLVVIRWDDSTDNVGVDRYDVYRDGVLIGNRPDTGASQFWFTASGLAEATTYDFEVRAVDAAGNESTGATLQATTTGSPPDTDPPGTPPNLTATNVQNNLIVIRWDDSTDNVGVDRYDVYRDGALVGTKDDTGSQQFWFVSNGLTSGTLYAFEVRAVDEAGNESVGATLDVTTTGGGADTTPPSTPPNLVSTNVQDTLIVIRWDDSTDDVGVDRYDVYRDGVLFGSKDDTGAGMFWWVSSGLLPGTEYSFEVRAVDAAGNESIGATLDVTTSGGGPDTEAPTTPPNLVATSVSRTVVVIRWDDSSDNVGVDRYDVYRDGVLVGTKTDTGSAQFWFTSTGLTPGTLYAFEVRAVDAAGNESVGATLDVTTNP